MKSQHRCCVCSFAHATSAKLKVVSLPPFSWQILAPAPDFTVAMSARARAHLHVHNPAPDRPQLLPRGVLLFSRTWDAWSEQPQGLSYLTQPCSTLLGSSPGAELPLPALQLPLAAWGRISTARCTKLAVKLLFFFFPEVRIIEAFWVFFPKWLARLAASEAVTGCVGPICLAPQ